MARGRRECQVVGEGGEGSARVSSDRRGWRGVGKGVKRSARVARGQ